jgi:hypothetical protein
MKRVVLGAVVVVGVAMMIPATAQAQWWDVDYEHDGLHDHLEHRAFHRELTHRQAHRYPMTWREHEDLHDELEHDAYHDHLIHRAYHRGRAYDRYHGSSHPRSKYGRYSYGRCDDDRYGTPGFSIWIR